MTNRIEELEAIAKGYCSQGFHFIPAISTSQGQHACACRELRFARMEELLKEMVNYLDTHEETTIASTSILHKQMKEVLNAK